MTAPINTLTQQPITDDQLSSVVRLAEDQIFLTGEIEGLNSQIQILNDKLRQVREIDLPLAMTELGMESFTLKDGTSINIEKFYSAKIPEEKQGEAFAWLRANNFDSLIKREIKANFGKGEDAVATKVIETLLAMGTHPSDKTSVHPQTLKSFVRERVEGGHELPTELFGVFVGNRAKLTPAK